MDDNRGFEAQQKVSKLFKSVQPALDALLKSITWAMFPDEDTRSAFQEDELLYLMWANANTAPLRIFCKQLVEIAENYKDVNIFPTLYTHYSASGYFLLIGEKYRALEFFPEQPFELSSQRATEHLLSLKYAVDAYVSARDVLTLSGPQVTSFGKEHLNEIMSYIDTTLQAQQHEAGNSLVVDWVRDSKTYWYNIGLGNLVDPTNSQATKIERLLANAYCTNNPKAVKAYSFSENKRVLTFIKSMTRQAENIVREEAGIPRVGEGWIAETKLYYEIKKVLSHLEILHHASPDWLGRQHLDIFIPELSVAVEYQGAQHDQPVEFFGGVDAFEKTQKRDAKKRRLCKKHSVRLVYVRPGYDLQGVIKEILGNDD